ncbi:hypothetical protein M409DRAFT_16874 [Zasmidium cellare ATCC 36951]|uniref:Myb-like domain-containing protein n=1 Tax=Zasmidium cellare ATCC 36951 TaxID=1080233 RepID=A0A6A6D443_ZASCE|nr:uncharacterized protein M409DRAFT_16874 [Zasmidium cellare ATCC 36951]KAF2172919.1 hypothetical protein M409DRAFT_16874 [Zasmidium cellare ATCC 36951]
MAMMHGSHTTKSNQSGMTPTFHHHEPSFFEDSFQYDFTSVSGDGATQQLWPDLQYTNLHNFRPAEPTEHNFHSSFGSVNTSTAIDADDVVLRKVENSPTLPALPYKVDTSKYENVDYQDYITRPMEYESSSPSTIETESNGPPTPVTNSPFRASFDDPFPVMRRDSFVPKVESAPLLSGPHVMLDNTSLSAPTCHVPLSVIFNEAQHHQPPAEQTSFALHSHAHGGLMNNMTAYQGFNAPSTQPTLTADSFDMSSASSVPDLDRPFLDTTSDEDTDSDSGTDTDSEHSSELEASDRAVSEATHRRERDRYLLKMREKGYSYKDIKRRGRFTEAESTLRGRVRVMTKHKSQRVRKPVWKANDIRLLEDAVDMFADSVSARYNHGRIPWKKISDWMKDNGSSYTFAGATCARKWKALK